MSTWYVVPPVFEVEGEEIIQVKPEAIYDSLTAATEQKPDGELEYILRSGRRKMHRLIEREIVYYVWEGFWPNTIVTGWPCYTTACYELEAESKEEAGRLVRRLKLLEIQRELSDGAQYLEDDLAGHTAEMKDTKALLKTTRKKLQHLEQLLSEKDED
jgi:hypothetical protein